MGKDKEEKLVEEVETSPLDKLNEELEKARADANHWKEEYYRAYADTSNLRKSLEEDHREAIKYRAAGFIEELVPALDAFYSALSIKAPTKEAENYKIGFEYIYRQIISVLEKEGFSAIEPKIGDKFDPSFMHALETIEGDEPNKVAKVHSKGYLLKGKLLRPVMVAVTIKKEEEKDNEDSEVKKA